ncbi:motility accessory factor [Campylobacter peloridis]|uniref:Motility accessory factor n=1 Tax=Campylobacter peloridis TaxID=488546 RepID=A0ABX6U033_9BACT|nr:motility accessory factor [Campylobacter peloridis]AJC84040.1 motility accessory factor [Campylobacter peloridis LMG 23910]QOQ89629.1 motility accessory factor [Campylobacter peloridis]
MNFFENNLYYLEKSLKLKLTKLKHKNQSLINSKNYFINLLNVNYKNHPILFIYGLGEYIQNIFDNKNLKYLVVFEDDLNIIYQILQTYNISNPLKEKRLILFDANDFDFNKAKELFLNNNFMFYSQITSILNYKDSLFSKSIQDCMQKAIKSIYNALQSSQECEVYIKHFCKNLPKTLTHPSVKELLNKHKAKEKNAVIVASGPSLIKQLPLLKEIQDKVSVFCVDGSYTILHKYGIKPDYVFCIEKDMINGKEKKLGSWKFFDNNFGEFDKNILFILSDTTNPQTIQNLEKNNRSYMIIFSMNSFASSFQFDDYGYCDLSFNSVANLAYNFAVSLEYENIILIGQDLAFGKDGNSHPNEFLHGTNLDSSRYEYIKTLGYGGKSEIYTHAAWMLYKEKYEYDITQNKNFITTYNATEGGARIEGTIEKPFKEICESIINKEYTKSFEKLSSPNKKDIYQNLKKALIHFEKINQKALKILNNSQELFLKIQNISLIINNLPSHLNLEESLNLIDFNQILNLKNEIKLYKDGILSSKYFSTILLSYMYTNECNFVKLECIDTGNAIKEKINQLSYILNHERHIQEITNLIQTQYFIINQTIADIQTLISKDFYE